MVHLSNPVTLLIKYGRSVADKLSDSNEKKSDLHCRSSLTAEGTTKKWTTEPALEIFCLRNQILGIIIIVIIIIIICPRLYTDYLHSHD
jgi:hypothetical protein